MAASEKGRDVTKVLEDDHKLFKSLVRKIKKAEPEERKKLAVELQKRVKAHSDVEEEIVYPVFAEAGPQGSKELVGESKTEHEAAAAALRKLLQIDPSTDAFDGAIDAVEETLTHHADEEEDEMFPQMKKSLDKDRLKELGNQVEQRLDRVEKEISH